MLKCRFVVLTLICCFFIAASQSGAADYICGDANSDSALNVGDAVYMINYVFKNGPAPPDGCCADCEDGQTEPCYTGPPSTEGVGECTNGIRNCILGVWSECVGQILPTGEDCDGLDNDCDGTTDEDLPPMPCINQEGVCAGSFRSCQGGAWQLCGPANYGPDYEAVEQTCDGLDNDCDGQADEDYSIYIGQPCWIGEGECARQGYYACSSGSLVCRLEE